MNIVVSLSSIPSRLATLPRCVESLLSQTRVPDQILINIPTYYQRFNVAVLDSEIPVFDSDRVVINRCNDFGPGTKLLGGVDLIPLDSLIILVDDDMAYKSYLVQSLSDCYLETGASCSFRVYTIRSFWTRRVYRIGKGADGFAIHRSMLDEINFYHSRLRGNKYLFVHDDLWISYYLYWKGIEIVDCHKRLDHSELVYDCFTDRDALKNVRGLLSRRRLNRKGIRFLEKTFGE